MNTEERANWTVWQEAETVAKFARDRRSGILGGAEQLEVMCQLLPSHPPDAPPARVLDLGCGDGILLEAVLCAWPGACGVALDGSQEMLARAEQRLSVAHASRTAYVLADFNRADWSAALPYREFDAVVSGFAIHHSEDMRKRALYAEIFALLRPGAVFVNIEHIASLSPLGEALFERAYVLQLVRSRRALGQEASFEAVEQEIRQRLDKSANRCTPVDTQLQWLRDIGYVDVDCYWKYYELAILAGYKPIRK